ncbi:cyclase family protein [Bizionia paragorgiae]|uniref:cyclase family protein n=1 Tax=Bizionia paragorgiae TaxID=283786 RepID=UPI003A9228E5
MKGLNHNSKKNQVFIDLSHTIESGLVTYKGLPAPLICDYLSREESRKRYLGGAEFKIEKLEMVGNTGTYLDSPFHRYADGKDLSQLELESLSDIDGVVINVPYFETLEITPQHIIPYNVRNRAVLFHTGWDQFWNTENYYEKNPYLTMESAEYLRDQQAKMVGIDSLNIDNTLRDSRPVHSVLLGANIYIVEHLCNLSSLPQEGFKFCAIPPKLKGVGSFPVRAFAKIPSALPFIPHSISFFI